MSKSFNYFVFYADGSRFGADRATAVVTNAIKTQRTPDHFEAWVDGDYTNSEVLQNRYNEALTTSGESNHADMDTRVHLKILKNAVTDQINKGYEHQELVNACFATFNSLGIVPETILTAIQTFYPQLTGSRRSRSQQPEPEAAPA